MTKKIERSRVEAGRAELPKKVGFLATEKVDYIVVFDRDGELSVEVPAAALSKLVKARSELKALKAAQKQVASGHAAALAAAESAHQETLAALAKAERRVKSQDKKLATAAEVAASPAPDTATAVRSAPKKGSRSGASEKPKATRKARRAGVNADTTTKSSAVTAANSALGSQERPGPGTTSADTVAPPPATGAGDAA